MGNSDRMRSCQQYPAEQASSQRPACQTPPHPNIATTMQQVFGFTNRTDGETVRPLTSTMSSDEPR